ncbi:MAG TPA: hypothetical protein VF530_23945 [Planctomycetota bacterium]
MPHVLEPATSGRAKCRGCARPIAQGTLRFGERIPNAFAEGETTLWFHLPCAAWKRPEPLLAALETAPPELPGRETLAAAARATLAHRRLARIDGAERAPSSQAKCRHCKQPIEKGGWRIRLVYYEEGRFSPGGTLHLACRDAYLEGHDVRERVLHFSAPEVRAELARDLDAPV